jgi:hypothetical protein
MIDESEVNRQDQSGSAVHSRRLIALLDEDFRMQRLLEVEGVEPESFLHSAESFIDRSRSDLDAAWAQLETAKQAHEAALESRSVTWSENILISSALVFALALIALIGTFIAKKFFGIFDAVPYTPFVWSFYGSLLLYGVASMVDRRLRRTLRAPAVAFERASTEYDRKIFSLVAVPAARAMQSARFVSPTGDIMRITDAPELSAQIDEDGRIQTRAFRRVFINLRRVGGATVGVAGPRGVGKTELLRSFCIGQELASLKSGGTVGTLISVPVAYDAVPFLCLLIKRLCFSVPGYVEDQRLKNRWQSRRTALIILAVASCLAVGALLIYTGGLYYDILSSWDRKLVFAVLLYAGAMVLILWAALLQRRRRLLHRAESADAKRSRAAKETTEASRIDAARFAERVAQRVRFVESLKVSGEVSVSKIAGAKVGSERTLSSLPLSAADLYLEFARLVDRLRESGYDVVIGIDELDKLYVDEGARKFLNDMKVLFTIRDCSFVVTISENAWSEFERRGLSIRDVFDSSLDTVVRVDQLSYFESRSFLRRRTESLSDTAIAFCQCLSGGLARDLLRTARSLGEANDELAAGATLDRVAQSV